MAEAKTTGNLPEGELHVFGSFSNGFKTGGSDLDIVYISDDIGNGAVRVLQTIMNLCDKYSFNNVTKIFQANVPILKFTDAESGVEVDFCINNRLGVRNSQLLQQYCGIDKRIKEIGRLVKAWAKKKDLVGTADGFLNSYAYMLLVIYFLQVGLEEPLLPNLQAMAQRKNFTVDNKWGRDERWDTKFFQDPEDGKLTPDLCRELTNGKFELDKNHMREAELLFTFFHFYTRIFDWKTEAVCIRCADPTTRPASGPKASSWIRKKCDKYEIMQNTCGQTGQAVPSPGSQQLHQTWYIEDPFDLRHNLAGKMTIQGKRRMLSEMERTMQQLSKTGNWETVCPLKDEFPPLYFLKCRISASVSPDLFIQEMEGFELIRLHMPKSFQKQRYGVAFLEFHCSKARRRAHTKNESYLNDCQLQIHYSSRWALEDAVAQQGYIHYDVTKYKLDKAAGIANPGILDANPGKMPPAPEHIRKAYLEVYEKRRTEYETNKHRGLPPGGALPLGLPPGAAPGGKVPGPGGAYPYGAGGHYFGAGPPPPYGVPPQQALGLPPPGAAPPGGAPPGMDVHEKLRQQQRERAAMHFPGSAAATRGAPKGGHTLFPVQTRITDEHDKEVNSVVMPIFGQSAGARDNRLPPPPKPSYDMRRAVPPGTAPPPGSVPPVGHGTPSHPATSSTAGLVDAPAGYGSRGPGGAGPGGVPVSKAGPGVGARNQTSPLVGGPGGQTENGAPGMNGPVREGNRPGDSHPSTPTNARKGAPPYQHPTDAATRRASPTTSQPHDTRINQARDTRERIREIEERRKKAPIGAPTSSFPMVGAIGATMHAMNGGTMMPGGQIHHTAVPTYPSTVATNGATHPPNLPGAAPNLPGTAVAAPDSTGNASSTDAQIPPPNASTPSRGSPPLKAGKEDTVRKSDQFQ